MARVSRQALRFAAVLVCGVGVLTWLAGRVVDATTRGWFEKDVALRAQLAVSGSRRILIEYWTRSDLKELGDLLGDIARDGWPSSDLDARFSDDQVRVWGSATASVAADRVVDRVARVF
jgi:hypothetical protein